MAEKEHGPTDAFRWAAYKTSPAMSRDAGLQPHPAIACSKYECICGDKMMIIEMREIDGSSVAMSMDVELAETFALKLLEFVAALKPKESMQ